MKEARAFSGRLNGYMLAVTSKQRAVREGPSLAILRVDPLSKLGRIFESVLARTGCIPAFPQKLTQERLKALTLVLKKAMNSLRPNKIVLVTDPFELPR
ncbi:hypothetical protein [Arcticibacter sp. MXS-1]|uniref:hypothetical protein n=1 Tax=Arcticibacter sp. MXS-1 TaxID=3341726 RepID=UPI0035A913AB